MKKQSRESSVPAGLLGRGFAPALFLALLCSLVTGCPHNDYTVELRPTGHGVERTLTFYRADGGGTNGPNYEAFPTNELAAITQVYPAGAVKEDGQRHFAKAEFAGAMPKDVGGAGFYTNYVTSLGESGFYSERFRGDDDLAGRTLKQFQAADQFTELVIGWSKTEFGHERGYKKLRAFLDKDFRRDLKNAGQYLKMGTASASANTNATEEFSVRYCQYLIERGYVQPADAPKLPSLLDNGGGNQNTALALVQKLVAGKMEIPAGGPMPKSLAILTNAAALEKSWDTYMAHTDVYHAKHKDWEEKVKNNPQLAEPKPMNVDGNLFMGALGITFDLGGETDHLTVKLALKHAPDHSNGKWKDGQVVWETDLENDRPLPVLCYAGWDNPDEQFQKSHFGRVLMESDDLSEYNLWRNGLSQTDGEAWDAFLSGLQPGSGLKKSIETFGLSTGDKQGPFGVGCKLLAEEMAKTQPSP